MKKIFTILGIVALSVGINAQIVINEVYGGGGNSGSTYTHDFVELINNGAAPVTLSNATLQYASSSGTFNQYHPLPTITLVPGQTYLIQEQAGSGGSVSLNPDFVAPIPTNFGSGTNSQPGFAMSSANMKIALVSNDVQITGPTSANVLDFVGIGTANAFEGTGAATGMSNTASVSRTNGIDTNNNAADFTAGAPTPTNSTLSVSDITSINSNFVRNTLVTENIYFGSEADVKIYNMNGQVVRTAKVSENNNMNVSDLQPGAYIVTGIVNGQPVSQKILKK